MYFFNNEIQLGFPLHLFSNDFSIYILYVDLKWNALPFYIKQVCTHPKSNTSLLPEAEPIVLSTFGKLASVRTPSPPTAGPHEKGPALKSIKAHLLQNMNECE